MLTNIASAFGIGSLPDFIGSKTAEDVVSPPTTVSSEDTDPGGFFDPYAFAQDYNALTQAEAQRQRSWSAEQAQKAMDFEERMSNTAYQRASADMKAAGLNPYLLMSQGGGSASTPSGVQASTSQAPVYSNNDTLKRDIVVFEALMGVVNTALKAIL